MKVTVSKMTTNDNTYRTPLSDIDGMPYEPEEGKSLLLTSSTHESGGIFTSVVERVEKTDEGYIVDTMNSVYVIHVQEG